MRIKLNRNDCVIRNFIGQTDTQQQIAMDLAVETAIADGRHDWRRTSFAGYRAESNFLFREINQGQRISKKQQRPQAPNDR